MSSHASPTSAPGVGAPDTSPPTDDESYGRVCDLPGGGCRREGCPACAAGLLLRECCPELFADLPVNGCGWYATWIYMHKYRFVPQRKRIGLELPVAKRMRLADIVNPQ